MFRTTLKFSLFFAGFSALCSQSLAQFDDSAGSTYCYRKVRYLFSENTSVDLLYKSFDLSSDWQNLTKAINPAVKYWGEQKAGTVIDLALPLTFAKPSEIRSALAKGETTVETNDPGSKTGLLCRFKVETYIIKDRSSLSEILMAKGVGTVNAYFRLYGKYGWVTYNTILNPTIGNWADVKIGDKLVLAYPVVESPVPATPAVPATPIVPPKIEIVVPPPLPGLAADLKLALPGNEPLSELSMVGEPMMEFTERRERVVAPAVVKEAWDMSIIDAMSSPSTGVVEGVASKPPGGYFSLRYGTSLADSQNYLTPKIKTISLLAEIRSGWFDGLRLVIEKVPKAKDKIEGVGVDFSLERILIGWAFEIPMSALVDAIHITPRAGAYSIDALLPTTIDEKGVPTVDRVTVKKAIGYGLELDAELARFWYILRGWYSQDFPSKQKYNSVLSSRFGLDLFVKGLGLSGNTSLAYLIYLANENIDIRGRRDDLDYTVTLQIIQLGLGFSFSW